MVSLLSGGAWRAVRMAAVAEHPPLVQWFEQQTGGTVDGEARVRATPVHVRGRLRRDAVRTDYGAQLQLAVSHLRVDGAWVPVRGGLAVSVSGVRLDDLGHWRAGRYVGVPVAVRRPVRYRNAGLADQVRGLARRGTPVVGSTKSGLLVEVEAPGAWWDEWASHVRARVRHAMAAHVGPHDATSAAIGTAILIGDRAQLAPEVERRLQEAGTYHVVAISGGNIALLAGAVLTALWCVGIRFAPAAAITAMGLGVHAWVIGGGPSVSRATAMAVIYLVLRFLDQRTAPVHAVALAGAGILAANPLEIAGAGFWLTFGATAALLMAAARWVPARPPRWWSPLVAVTLASIAVEVLLMPVAAFVFERVTLAGLVLNLAAVPAMGMVQAAASLCVAAEAAGLVALADVSGQATHLAARVLLSSSGLVTEVPWTTWRVPPPSVVVLAAYYLTVAVWWWASAPPIDSWRRRCLTRVAAAAIGGLWLWIATAPLTWLPLRPGAPLRVTAMDVGQGDAVLVTAPDGRTVMVDTGGVPAGAFDIGERVVGPSLRARGLRRLDYLAITHGDLDHLGGALALLRDFRPREVWAGVPVAGHGPLDTLRGEARALRTPWRWWQRGDRLEMGGLEIRAHNPPLPEWERQRVRNDDSLVLEVRHGAVSVWLTGDVSRAVEGLLAEAVEPGRIAIVKAPHHGSLTSSGADWVRGLRPAAVIVSAGRGNLFGHPAPAVLRRYAEAGAEVFRTDQDGQIELVTNGHYVEVTTFTGRRWRLR
jgi:competence protein ComEC